MAKSESKWVATRYSNLYRNEESGTYYARFKINSKEVWRSLRTKILSVAREELPKCMTKERAKANTPKQENSLSAKLTLGEALQLHLEAKQRNPKTKDSTKVYWQEIHEAVVKSWPQGMKREVRKISQSSCEEWAYKLSKQFSPNRFNNSLSAIKNSFKLAVKGNVITQNPAGDISRVKPIEKDLGLILPEPEEFTKWIDAIRTAHHPWANQAGDFVEFQTYSGLRPDTESPFVTWLHCDFNNRQLVVTGSHTEGTKNRKTRRVDMSDDLYNLLKRMRAERKSEPLDSPVLQVKSARRSMDTAAKKIGLEHMVQYDLRHLFATRCLESGVDAATVAEWLGHQDKGALLLKVYSHVRKNHKQKSAQKVSFK